MPIQAMHVPRLRHTPRERMATWIAQAAAAWPQQVRIIDLTDLTDLSCPDGICCAARGEMLVYRDNQHLNAPFVATLVQPLAERLGVGESAPAAPNR